MFFLFFYFSDFCFFSPSLRRSSCSCLPCGGEGHGATRGAGAGRRTDRSVHGHILLPRSGHSVKKEKRPQNEPAWRTEQKPKRVERANQRLSFIRCHRCYGDEKRWQRGSGPTGQDVLQQSHPSLTKLYTWRSFFFRWWGQRHLQPLDSKAMLRVFFPSVSVPTAFPGTMFFCLRRLNVALVGKEQVLFSFFNKWRNQADLKSRSDDQCVRTKTRVGGRKTDSVGEEEERSPVVGTVRIFF